MRDFISHNPKKTIMEQGKKKGVRIQILEVGSQILGVGIKKLGVRISKMWVGRKGGKVCRKIPYSRGERAKINIKNSPVTLESFSFTFNTTSGSNRVPVTDGKIPKRGGDFV